MNEKQKNIVIETDVLVIGGGWAGFFAAIKAKEDGVHVTLVEKGYASRAGQSARNDGHMTVYNKDWGSDLDAWHKQTAVTGEYMNNPAWTEASCVESYERYQDILSWGIVPPRDDDGKLLHPFPLRYPGGIDAVWLGWGYNTMPQVRKYALDLGVNIVDRLMITDLIKQDGVVSGAVGIGTQTGDFYVLIAKSTVVCTGSSTFKSQAPAARCMTSSFDGEAMAYRAGAEISGMEFACMARWKPYVGEYPENSKVTQREGRQIHNEYSEYINWLSVSHCPIVLYGNYIDADGHGEGPFHPFSLMTVHEGKGPMLMDTVSATKEAIEKAAKLYPPDYEIFEAVGASPVGNGLFKGDFDMAESFMGRHMGGSGGLTSIDLHGGTSLPGLYGAGDAYHSAVSGSVYPNGGTGIRVAAVTGTRSGHAAAAYAKERSSINCDENEITRLRDYALGPKERNGGFDPEWVSTQITNVIMPYYVFGVRSGRRLQAALTMVEFLEEHISPMIHAEDAHQLTAAHEARNRIIGAKMMLASALYREESRGLQYREDFPSRDDAQWHCHTIIKQVDDNFTLSKMPIDEWWPDFVNTPYIDKYKNRYRGEVIPE